MKYRIEFEKKAVKFISKQPKPQKERLFKAIYKLPESGDIKVMQGESGFFRLRVGDYRVIYTVNDNCRFSHKLKKLFALNGKI